MKKIAIVCDSSVSFTKEEVDRYDVYIAPLILTHHNRAYVDGIDITNIELNNLLREKVKVTTSQPNIGTIIDILEYIKSKEYDHTYILSVGTSLSGALGGFSHALKNVNLDNCTLVNTYSITGPVQQMVRAIRTMNEEDKSIEEITSVVNGMVNDQVSYLFPRTLDAVIQSGRVSRASATVASLLKVRVLLFLAIKAEAIEKMTVARSEKKIFQSIIDDFIKHKVSPRTHDIYLLESEGMETLLSFKVHMTEKLGDFKTFFVNLPAAVAVHGGIGCIAVQFVPKINL